jgi:hypothetical protein
VLGFGTMGTNALLQILRNVQLDGSKVRVLIVDKDRYLGECFNRRYPMIGKLCCDIEFVNADAREDRCVIKAIDENNPDYIIVSYSNDRENLELAYDISKCYSKRKDIPLPIIAVSQKYGQKEDITEDMFGAKILFFGNEREIYTKETIISEDNDYWPKILFSSYRMGNPENAKTGGDDSAETTVAIKDRQPDMEKINAEWNKLDWVSQESERASADFMPGLLRLIRHESTEAFSSGKLVLSDEVMERLASTENMRWCAFHASIGFDLIESEDMQSRYDELKKSGLSNYNALAICRKDVKNRLHACLVPWDELDNVNDMYRPIAKNAYDTSTEEESNEDWDYALTRDFKDEYRKVVKEAPLFKGINN